MIRGPTAITLETCLQDVETRFLLNLPESELQQSERLFFQIEQAWWYYEDFFADKYTNILPHYKTLQSFAETIFVHCPLLSKISNKCYDLFNEFGEYKNEIPVCGCILLSSDLTKMALICSWSGHSWSFPKGKLDQDETFVQCAIRETFEETGYIVPVTNCYVDDALVNINESKMVRMFIVTGVPDDTVFIPQTRKEVSKVEFFPIDSLPKRTYGIIPFIPKLKRWIQKFKKSNKSKLTSPSKRAGGASGAAASAGNPGSSRNTSNKTPVRMVLRNENNRSSNQSPARATSSTKQLSRNKSPAASALLGSGVSIDKQQPQKGARNSSNNNSTTAKFDARNSETFSDEQAKRWTVTDMFAANSKLTGLKYEYDGNPHSFGSSHPRFVNYRSNNENEGAGSNGGDDNIIDLTKNSSVSLLGADNYKSSAISRSSQKRPRNIFNLPFILDTAAVLSAVDLELTRADQADTLYSSDNDE